MPVIRISDNTYKRLADLAVGFDTPANVIDRLLNECKSASGATSPQNTGGPPNSIKPSVERNKITAETTKEVCILGDRVARGELNKVDAVEELVRAGMNESSAKMYLATYCSLIGKGKPKGLIKNQNNIRVLFDYIAEVYKRTGFVRAVRAYEETLTSATSATATLLGVLDDMKERLANWKE